MRKFRFFFVLFALLAVLFVGYSTINNPTTHGHSAPPSAMSTTFWSLWPADKAKWPTTIRYYWQATHLRDTSVAQLGEQNWVPLTKVARSLPQAIITIEDRRFYEHGGVDLDGILRATLVNIQAQRFEQGASTLTQQLIKNAVLNSEQSLKRKLWEAGLAFIVESNYSKSDILEMYLNNAYYGAGATGIKAAAATYFGMEPFQLSLSESATLAALLNAPTALNPYDNPEGCIKRRDLVLAQMEKQGLIKPAELARAVAQPLNLKK